METPKPSTIRSRAEKFAAKLKSKPQWKHYDRKDAPTINGALLIHTTSTSKAFPEPVDRYADTGA